MGPNDTHVIPRALTGWAKPEGYTGGEIKTGGEEVIQHWKTR